MSSSTSTAATLLLLIFLSVTKSQISELFVILENNLPVCEDQEFATFNGSHIICHNMTERQCNCPEILPEPPPGCQKFAPPPGGGFVCLRDEANNIYCSVQCDNTSEFSNFPLNPYRCGPDTEFLWKDPVSTTYKTLPDCNSFRYSRLNTFPDTYYFPVPCDQLTVAQKNTEYEELLMDVQWIYGCDNCAIEQAYVECPPALSS